MTGRLVDFVLFDLGGVLIQTGGVTPMRELAGIETEDELWARWMGCRWVQAFESGRCTADDFAHGVVADWGLTISPAEFLQRFGTWPEGPYPGADLLLSRARKVVPVGFLSNMNAYQWGAHYDALPITHAFDVRFLSFELGLVKPDPQIFETVAHLLPSPPERVLYLDDNAVNVEAGSAAGFAAHHVRGIDETHRALVGAGVLDS